MAADVELAKRRFTVDEYHRMIGAGILTKKDRVELIEGKIVHMAPIGTRHTGCVAALNQWFVTALHGRALLRPQSPVTLPPDSEPEPGVALVRPRADFYRSQHPTADDVLLAIEVAETSLRYDCRAKLPLYARRGVREVWIVDLVDDAVEVHRSPAAGGYRSAERLTRGASVAPEAFPDVSLSVADILG